MIRYIPNAAKSASSLFLPSPPQRVIWNKGKNKMDADIKKLYKQLYCKYPLKLTSSFEKGFKTDIDYPILCGNSILGRFELFYGDLDFEFYAVQDNGQFLAHFHLQSAAEAEKTVIDFMNGKLTIIQFGQPNDT